MDYLMFCDHCGMPKPIGEYIMREYFWIASHVYCNNCNKPNKIPEHLQQLSLQMRKGCKGTNE
ncbi:hypothetical protein [Halalkalibacter nanhaiisediminis]|uniref:Uncharacterized protein n=1 Tax=Halalkalibacter nanhaiisediminis TaxID=688079 RepID=A0A562QN93_9BACI|nr:hypothetical protein [Halalkalibacter nanhaiisediminis]TWI58165.1 hypothetical protein IQ10_01498 [Halalkalibacter nanhaiisediminis]